MGSLNGELKHRVKSLAERTLGVSISRARRPEPNKHADEAIRSLRRWSSRDVVFDVGANDGRTVLRIQEQLSSPRIFAFEPASATYRKLVDRTAHLPNVRTFPVALGARPGRETMYLTEIDAMNSFSPAWTPSALGTESVEVRTVDELMAEHGVDFIHLLKVDTEGYEFEVIKGAERALRSSRVALIQLEVGVDQVPKPLLSLERARCHLAAHGYFLYGLYNQCRAAAHVPAEWEDGAKAGYRAHVLAYCDALFIRAEL